MAIPLVGRIQVAASSYFCYSQETESVLLERERLGIHCMGSALTDSCRLKK